MSYNVRMEAKTASTCEQFKVGMRTLAGAVNIITSAHAGHRYGMTATAVCSATADPPTVLVCINKLATTHGAVAKSKAFCVNVLRAEDWELSTTFSGAQSGEARFKSRRLDAPRHRLAGADRRAGVVRLPRGEERSRTARTPSSSARSSRCCSARRASRCSTPKASTPSSPRSPSASRCPKGLDYWGF